MSRPTPLARRSIRLAVTLAIAAGAAHAETAPDAGTLDEVVVTAAGFSQKIVDAPASISVVSAEELAKRPYVTLIDAVRDLEGVDVGETSDKTGQRTISLRGMGSEYTLVLIDGKRQNNHGDIYPNSFGGNQFNHIPPLDTIERIEVVRGPASTLYGADALGGVINIITRKVADKWSGSATVGHSIQENDAFGADTTYDLAASGPLIAGKLGLQLRASSYERRSSTPEFEQFADPNGQLHERALGFGGGGKTVDNKNRSFGATLNWQLTGRQDLSFDFDVSRQEYDNTPVADSAGNLTYPLGTVDNISSVWRTAWTGAAANGRTCSASNNTGTCQEVAAPQAGYAAEQRFNRDNWAVTHRGQWDFGSSFLSLARVETANMGRTLPFTVAEREALLPMIKGTGAYAGMSTAERRALAEATFLPRPARALESSQYTLDAKLDIPLSGFAGSHHLVVGGQFIDGELDDGVFGMESGGDGAGVVQEHRMYSLFVEDNWTPVAPLTFTAGIRYDDHDVFGDNFSPRGYAVYTISPAWTLKGGVSTGFKTPRTTDLFDGITGFGGQGVTPFIGNPDLKPETSVNYEAALYWTAAEGGHNFNVTYFRNDFKDKIARGETSQSCAATGGVRPCANLGAFAELGYLTYAQNINIDKAKVNGVEVAGRYRILAPLSLRANYTWTDSRQTSGPQAGQPITNTARHMANATLDWSVSRSFSTQLAWETRSRRFRGVDAVTGEHQYYKNYDVLNLGAQYRFAGYLTLSARINNLLDRDFTGYRTSFIDADGDGLYSGTTEIIHSDDYNNKDKARNYWLSLNLAF